MQTNGYHVKIKLQEEEMKKIWIIPILAILLVSSVMAVTLSRNLQSTVAPNSQFSVTYQTSGAPADKWFVAWEESITGGCTPSTYKDFMASETGGDKSTTVSFTAPSSGSCTFSGFYEFTGGTQTNFPSITVTVCEDTCSSLGYSCGVQTICGQAQNCGTCTMGYLCNIGTCNAPIFNELINFANGWVTGTITFQELLNYANAWVTG
jgi:hypothetical protein